MLKPVNRLIKVRDFNLLMKRGRWLNGRFLDLKVLDLRLPAGRLPKNEDPAEFVQQLRVAFTVGLKISKSAAKRNRVKRQLREIIRLLIKQDRIFSGKYLLFVARQGILEQEYRDLEQKVWQLLKRARTV